MELLASSNYTKQNKILKFYHIYHAREILYWRKQNTWKHETYIEKKIFVGSFCRKKEHIEFCFYSIFFAEQAIFQPPLKFQIDYIGNFNPACRAEIPVI